MVGDSKKWQDTLYIWDGIVTSEVVKSSSGSSMDDDDNNNNIIDDDTKQKEVAVSWEGTWIPVEACPDASQAAAPKRNAFAEYIDSDLRFHVTGIAVPVEDNERQELMFVCKLIEGDGWDMKDGNNGEPKKKYQDKEHNVMVKTLRWSGNMFDQTDNLIVAKGYNEFGSFVSAGWMRPGNRWTLARRYLADEEDPRTKLSLQELQKAIMDESVTVVEETGQKKLNIPPWHCTVLHSEYQEPPAHRGGKRKREKEDGELAATSG